MSVPETGTQGWINLTIGGSVLSLGLTPARVRIDGQPVSTTRGANLIPVAAGGHHLDVEIRYFWVFGQAEIDVDVPAGQTVPVWYTAPFTNVSRGAIGLERLPAPDRWWYAAVMILLILGAVGGAVTYAALG